MASGGGVGVKSVSWCLRLRLQVTVKVCSSGQRPFGYSKADLLTRCAQFQIADDKDTFHVHLLLFYLIIILPDHVMNQIKQRKTYEIFYSGFNLTLLSSLLFQNMSQAVNWLCCLVWRLPQAKYCY